MVINPALLQLLQSFSVLGIVTFLVNIIAPFLERYAPFAKPGSSTHDATLRLLNLVLNIGLALGAAVYMGQLGSGQAALAAIGFGIAQATGSHVLYSSGNRKAPAPANMSAAPAPEAASPSSAPARAPLSTLVAPSTQSVADAVNAAMAAQASASAVQ